MRSSPDLLPTHHRLGFPEARRPVRDVGRGRVRCGNSLRTAKFPADRPWFAPMMFDLRKSGVRVEAELYAVDNRQLARLDELEFVGTPGNFRRQVEVETISPRRVDPRFRRHERPENVGADPF